MKIKDLIKKLETFDKEIKVLASCDEELNTMYNDFEISELEGYDNTCVIFPLSGTEVEEVF